MGGHVVFGGQQHAGKAGHRRGQGEGQAEGPLDVDADDARTVHVLGHGAHGLAEPCLFQHQVQDHHEEDHDDDQSDFVGVDAHEPQLEASVDKPGDVLDPRAEGLQEDVFPENAQAEQEDDHREFPVLGLQERAQGGPVDSQADGEHYRHGNEDGRKQPHAEVGHEQPGEVSAGNGDDAVAEIEDVGHAVNDGQAQRHAGVQGAGYRSADESID